ncbi:MAG: hypothetical protein BWK76_00065 [Desulfobulbaceae bacterium A2]|nr:MAG: hypothetical protein BWK76_00065 [Desulfobulbaceae bacterium A2]
MTLMQKLWRGEARLTAGRERLAWYVVVPCGVLLIMAFVWSNVWAMEGGGREGRPPGGPGKMVEGHGMPSPPPRCAPVLYLGLTDVQQQQILDVHEEGHKAVEGAMRTLREQRDALQKIARAESFDEKGLRTLLSAGTAARTELQVQRLRDMNRVWNILTPAQRELAAQGGVAPHGWGWGMPPEPLFLEGGE